MVVYKMSKKHQNKGEKRTTALDINAIGPTNYGKRPKSRGKPCITLYNRVLQVRIECQQNNFRTSRFGSAVKSCCLIFHKRNLIFNSLKLVLRSPFASFCNEHYWTTCLIFIYKMIEALIIFDGNELHIRIPLKIMSFVHSWTGSEVSLAHLLFESDSDGHRFL